MCAVVWGEVAGTLSFHLWHIIATAGIVLAMITISLTRQFNKTERNKILNPRHVKEVAEVIGGISSRISERTVVTGGRIVPEVIPVSSTSLGIQISSGKIEDSEVSVEHYAFSSQKETMTEKTAEIIADLIIQLKKNSCERELVTQNRGIFHLLIRSSPTGVSK
jgi:hypothetical protein